MEKPLLEKGNGAWLSELLSINEKCNNTIQSSVKMTPIQASEKSNGKVVFSNLQNKIRKQKPKFKLEEQDIVEYIGNNSYIPTKGYCSMKCINFYTERLSANIFRFY